MTLRDRAENDLRKILSNCHPSMIIPRLMEWLDDALQAQIKADAKITASLCPCNNGISKCVGAQAILNQGDQDVDR